jgi:hypothetical protein
MIEQVELEIVYKLSAFDHGVTEAGIRHVFETARYDGPDEDDPEKRLLIGFDENGNAVEIMYNELDDGRYNVFHSMPLRKIYFHLLNPEKSL